MDGGLDETGAQRLGHAVMARRELMRLSRKGLSAVSSIPERTLVSIEEAEHDNPQDSTLFALDAAFAVDGGTSRDIWRGVRSSYPPPPTPQTIRLAQRIAALGDDADVVSLLVSRLSDRRL